MNADTPTTVTELPEGPIQFADLSPTPGLDRARHAVAVASLGALIVVMGSVLIYDEVSGKRRKRRRRRS